MMMNSDYEWSMHGMWAANMVNFRENPSKLDYFCLIDVAMYYN